MALSRRAQKFLLFVMLPYVLLERGRSGIGRWADAFVFSSQKSRRTYIRPPYRQTQNHGYLFLINPHQREVPSVRTAYGMGTLSSNDVRSRPYPNSPSLSILNSASFSSEAASSSRDLTNDDGDDDSHDDTIYALSTGAAASGQATAVAVIRITGPDAHSILETLTPTHKFMPKPRVSAVRTLKDVTQTPPVLLDQALVLLFHGPNSFTGQDVVELHCHGSRAVVQGILDALSHHARLAEPGEFTQRAFWNGKLELLQVEALADLLTADTQTQRQQALQQLEGTLTQLYEQWRVRLTKGLAHAEAVIDFGDDERLDEEDGDNDAGQWNVWGGVGDGMSALRQDMQRHLQDARRGELVREGVKIAIVGPPNAGKSSLFNVLAQRDAAIVSPIAGTTRDVLELALDLGGVRCTLSDTAGVRQESSDVIELEGMKRARNAAQNADVVVAMVDGTEAEKGISALKDILKTSREQGGTLDPNNVLLVLNKQDLQQEGRGLGPTATTLKTAQNIRAAFEMSCETNRGVDSFLDALTETVVERISSGDSPGENEEGAIITRARHRQHVEAAVEALSRFETLSTQGTMAVDMAAEELRLATSEMGRITGAVDVEDVLDVLFTDFCIGK